MKQMAAAAGLVAMVLASRAHATEWLFKEFLDKWNAPGQSVEEFINNDCQPAGLDGIQLIGIQKGHGEVLHLHVYCRHDRSTTARYQVTRPTEPRGMIDSNVKAYLSNPRVRIGPFWFGAEPGVDGFFLIEKVR
jgi:hypothetical protein